MSPAEADPWHGYNRIAGLSRRWGTRLTDRQASFVMRVHDLGRKRKRAGTLAPHQAVKLDQLLPTAPNEVWQMDVTYVHIPR